MIVTLSAQSTASHVDRLPKTPRSPVRVDANTHSSGGHLIIVGTGSTDHRS
jgi:hypothetical protein